jgi:hypothetical protein
MSAAPPTPAVCQTCGTVFAMPGIFGPGMRVHLQNVGIGPCPNCGGTGLAPDGFYDFTGEVLNIVSTWPQKRLQQIIDAITAAREGADPRAAVEEVIKTDSDLASLLSRLSPLTDASSFWAFVAVLLTTLNMMASPTSDPTVTINKQTVIEKVVQQAAPTVPGTETPTAKVTKKPPPPPPRRKSKRSSKRKK